MENSITVTLPIIGTASGMSADEKRIVEAMDIGRRYNRAELELSTGFSKSKTVRLLNSLIDKSLITVEGNNRSKRYIHT